MDLGSTITAVVIVLICVLPSILMSRKNKKKKQQFLEALSDFARKSNSKISRHDIWHSAAIGIDQESAIIFFSKKTNGSALLQQVSLNDIRDCRLINTGTVNGEHYTAIDKLELAFNYHDKSREQTVFEFYAADATVSNLSGELELANNWLKIVNDTISALPQRKK